jgi:transitional endoplasmic reticulum ATPase
MSFLGDKKREHEAAAVAAYDEGKLAKAAFHYFKSADFGLRLAGESEGKIKRRYVGDAFELIELAEKLKAKASAKSKAGVRQAMREGSADEEEASKTDWELKERPMERLSDVAGLDEVKAELREKVIEPFLHPELFERFKLTQGGGVLMFGPPGNGKTFIARAVAGELDAAFFPVNSAEIKDKYVGETEKNMQRLFEAARQHAKSVIFLDEVDHLLAKRGNRKIGAVAQFLSLTDGLVKIKNCILVLAATNKPWMLDEAVIRPGRIGTHIYVGPPDVKAREAIIGFNLKDVPVAGEVVAAELAGKTEGYSGADVAELCDRAKRSAKNRQVSSGKDEEVTNADFAAALEKVKPSVTVTQLKEYEAWRESRQLPKDAGDTDE